LWGLIKQGWKCKDCGINAHRECRHRVVMECRPKSTSSSHHNRTSIQRQISDSQGIRSQPSFRKTTPLKQKSTQTECAVGNQYDDIFLSDDSITSNEDISAIGSNLRLHPQYEDLHFGSFESNTNIKSNDHTDQSPSSSMNLLKPSGRRRNKKLSKRRKSLPSQGSSNEETHQAPLIPRGPLICSNSEHFGNWLPDKLSNNQVHITSITSTTTTTTNAMTNTTEFNPKLSNTSSPIKKPKADSTNKDNNLNNLSTISNECERDIEPISKQKHCKLYRIVDSDYFLSEYIDDYNLDDEILDTTFSSNDDESSILKRLKELENEKNLLVQENFRIKKQLEKATSQIEVLKQEMTNIRKDTVDYIINQMDNIHVNNGNSNNNNNNSDNNNSKESFSNF
jgi:hypothetical protein